MFYTNRDQNIQDVKPRGTQACYGMGIGIITMDDPNPAFPGDTCNPSAYPFPIQYEQAVGVDKQALNYEDDNSQCVHAIAEAAKRLESLGCRAVVGNCGYYAIFQKEIANMVSVPVFMSPLLQIPLARQTIASDKAVGIITVASTYLTQQHLDAAGVVPGSNIKICGLFESERCPGLVNLYCNPDLSQRTANYQEMCREIVGVVSDFCQVNPDVRTLVLECTGLPPFARAIQLAVDLPVFCAGTLLEYAYSVVRHREYYGNV